MRNRTSNFWEEQIQPILNSRPQRDAEFKAEFRVTPETFARIVNNVRPFIEKADTRYRTCISVEKRVGIGLYTLASVDEYRVIGNLFGVSKASVCIYFKSLMRAIINSHLLKSNISIPNHEEFKSIAEEFESRTGYPNACGAIVGTHIRFKVPVDQRASYYNHNGDCSVLTLAICTAKGHFW